ncbi:MAG: ORF6N domain-containing protein [Candidatus Delongbacteria bacterium]|nr:ORF6N domain-containing protein [Candidatus Delongbacteria bacterium]MCG2760704.1 ORF6N domain-containing protein [Candidatus Delongbacteria bacterium]
MAKNDVVKFDENVLRDRIYSIRGFQVMMDRDLAELYEVKPFRLREQVKRNQKRFPNDFMFRLSKIEISYMVSQNAIPSLKHLGGSNPYVFTEQGVAALSSILTSDKAIDISIMIMRTFVEMRKFIQANGHIFQRLDRVEIKLLENDQKFEKVFNALESQDRIPDQGIFFEGQVFDAYKFVSDLFRSAEKSIVIIDNYIDDTVLVHLTKISKSIKVKILKKSISEQFKLDIKKFGEQYSSIEAYEFKHSHDRFIIIDGSIVYLFGASLKDLGKKLFGFTKMDKSAMRLIDKVNST